MEKHDTHPDRPRSTSVCSGDTVLIEPRPNTDTAGQRESYGEPDANAVDINAAINDYMDLKRELSHISRVSSVKQESKLEEGNVEDEVFNLDDFLRGMDRDAQTIGAKPKHLGLIWKNLVVEGKGADAFTIPTFLSGILHVVQFWKFFGIGTGTSSTKTILHNLTGFAKPGEMLLVLGRPGAGCSSLLKVLSNIRSPYTRIDGEVSYGGIDPATFAKHYRGQVVYNEEEDQHYPTLTTQQTLQFALRNKTPGKRLPDESRADFAGKIIYLLGNMLGLTKQMNTMVGNAFVRGLSGGERKRLSIAEVMTTMSSINLWDCSTRGLDAASALDYVRSLRIMTDIFNKTTVATLYQASNSIFHLFDKVLLLDEGYCIYFGPVSEAKQYFADLGFYCPPRKSVPDFLTGICNPLEREFLPGFEDSAPRHAKEFQDQYYKSYVYKAMMEELQTYEQHIQDVKPADTFRSAVAEEHQKRAPKSQPYTASFYQQVVALTLRQFQLIAKDYEGLVCRYGTILIQGLLSGSCFYNLPLTGVGAYSRGAALLFCVFFNTFISQSELISFLTGRPVLEKHKHFAMFRPSAFYIAQVIVDIPYAIAQVLLYELCSYFLMGLNLSAGRFFTYFITVFFLNMGMNGYFRMFGTFTDRFMLATQTSGVIVILLYNYCGFMINYKFMHPWLYWIYWMNPIAWGYKALIVNEMSGQVYSCEGAGNSIPYGPGYDDWNYRVCTMKGGNPGENFVRGDDYLRNALSFEPNQLWAPDFLVLVGYFLLFTFVTAAAMEWLSASKSSTLTKLYLPGKAPKPRTIEEEDERRRKQQEVTDNMDAIATGTTFSWQHVNYTVPFKGGPLQLLNDVSGIVKPGHLTALMGSSGAGKTTLLDVLARRKTIGKVDGRIYLNNEALMRDFERITGYCEQMDIHQPAVTVREALQFSAYLRQEDSVPKAEKDAYVEQILQLLEMEDIADAQIGDVGSGFGISVEERKRLTIAMELVGKPKLLFLDEPTSGLDAQSSYNIVRFIRKLADAGWPVLCTIHQPSAILFEHFDHLLLLVRGGKTAYYGEIGKDARTMIDYFENHGGPKCSPEANPAEYILEVVGAGTAGKAKRDWADVWANSAEAKQLQDELEAIHEGADKNPSRQALTYATPFPTQFYHVFKRLSVAYWRASDYNLARLATLLVIGLFAGFTYWKMSFTTTDMQNRLFAVFNGFVGAYILVVVAQPKFMTERLYFRREYASRFYGWLPFSLSAILVEIPYLLVFTLLFMCTFYWTAGMHNTSEACGYFFIMLFFFIVWAVTFGFLLGSLTESAVVAGILNPLAISSLVLFSGLMQPQAAMPHFWSSWMYWVDPFHYFIEGLGTNEMGELPVICDDRDLIALHAPPNQTCGQYMSNFFKAGGTGYLVDENAMNDCQYCTYKSGQEYYSSSFGWDASHKWRNLGLIVCYAIFNCLVFVVLCYWKRKPRR
ncbi:ABC-2 type transporter-domain-containing protein [Syncephalastrum racemosum]|uniref:ABC-2 type transporter-domain-containing protein n=1 Tax=Syncephalastrum racemosum TaxID=13706 RepID=A0A1X2HT86_SYNRA|nr:ABC-2 type transporter-domain-containing protein [Syncephalastrum racemosum]